MLFSVFVLLLLVCTGCLSAKSRDDPVALPFFKVPSSVNATSPHAVFHAIGSHFSERIREYAKQSSALNDRLIPWYNESQKNRDIMFGFVMANRNQFPAYFEELQGLSEGSGMPLLYILLLNFSSEIDALIDQDKEEARQTDTNCSDIFLLDAKKQKAALGHNEDADADIKDYAYMIEIQYPTYRFTAYCYPGYLPGNTFGFNSHGLVITTNAEFPKAVQEKGIARSFLNRHFYSARTTMEAQEMVKQVLPELITGFALNVVSLNNLTDVFNVEVAPGNMSIKQVQSYYGHFNQYDHLRVPEHYDPSSVHRAARYNQLVPVTSEQDIYRILGDTEDKQYPIYREGNPPDEGVKTVATAIYDLMGRKLTVYTSNPKTNPIAQLEFHM